MPHCHNLQPGWAPLKKSSPDYLLPTFPILLRLNCLTKRVYVHKICTMWWYDICTLWNIYHNPVIKMGFCGGWVANNLPASAGVLGSIPPPAQKDLLEKEMATIPVFLPGKTHGQRSLVGHSPLGCKRVAHDLATQNTHQLPIPMFLLCVVRTQDFLSRQI